MNKVKLSQLISENEDYNLSADELEALKATLVALDFPPVKEYVEVRAPENAAPSLRANLFATLDELDVEIPEGTKLNYYLDFDTNQEANTGHQAGVVRENIRNAGNGFEAWRRLYFVMNPSSAANSGGWAIRLIHAPHMWPIVNGALDEAAAILKAPAEPPKKGKKK